MSKEQLEIIKFLRNSEKTVASGMQPSELISRKDVDWLINRVLELEKQNKRYREVIVQIKNNIPLEFNHISEYEAKKNVIRLINIDNLVDEYLEGESDE